MQFFIYMFDELPERTPRHCRVNNDTTSARQFSNYQCSLQLYCCDMGQNDTIGKIELNPSFVLSSDNTNCKNDIQLFHQLFDELSVNRNYH